ncbi:MAG: metalloregulator ArsR/SmtB family transcription factor [Deltaproteobacteria bacterium]|nr:metalloregulator ArsR/SmtB family transcription factor [Deltaproteobacteria bacterium]
MVTALPRTELYRMLADPVRLKALALLADEELAVGELADLLRTSQPQVSKKVAPLRKAALVSVRKDGTRAYLRTVSSDDPVVKDALVEGTRLAVADGSRQRLPELVAAREDAGRHFFDGQAANTDPVAEIPPSALRAYIYALSRLLPRTQFAIDVGTGEGLFLELMAPVFERVLAIDRSPARLAQAAARLKATRLHNVRLREAELSDVGLLRDVDDQGGADLVALARTLHHSSRPGETLRQAARLLRADGTLLLLDYLPHDDEAMRLQGDVWLGFSIEELKEMFAQAGFSAPRVTSIPRAFVSAEHDGHLDWLVAIARLNKRAV